jgi:hypothetical protein
MGLDGLAGASRSLKFLLRIYHFLLRVSQFLLRTTQAVFFERSGGGNCEAISDGAVASSKVFDVHLYTRANITFKIGGALFETRILTNHFSSLLI